MSGYLRRLAARSLQAAPAVHPAVRLPYAPLPADDAPMAAAATPGVATLPFPPSAHPRRAAPHDADPRPPLREVEPPGDPRQAPAARSSAALPLPPTEHPEMDERASRPTPSPFIPLVVEAAPSTAGVRDAGRGRALPSAGAVSAVAAASPPARQGARAERDGLSVAAAAAQSVPTLPRGAAERAAAARAAADEGPAVVEVRIGRIEIAAPPPSPAPPRRAAGPERRPMTLSEYLERRRGRGR